MWQYLEGVEPPKKKTNQTVDDKRHKSRLYEAGGDGGRSRVFQPKWLTVFPWLEYIPSQRDTTDAASTSSKMFCKICKKYEEHGTFADE